jgi:hypothetical protein
MNTRDVLKQIQEQVANRKKHLRLPKEKDFMPGQIIFLFGDPNQTGVVQEVGTSTCKVYWIKPLRGKDFTWIEFSKIRPL